MHLPVFIAVYSPSIKSSGCFGDKYNLRLVYKPHSVQQQVPGRSSLLAVCRHTAQCSLPGTGALPVEGAHMEASSLPPSADDFVPAWPCSRRGLPGRAHYCARRWSFTPPFHPYNPTTPPQNRGRLGGVRSVSVALSGRFTPLDGYPAPGATRRHAQWSADFPRPRQRRAAIARPT